jgi:hypothetical protein
MKGLVMASIQLETDNSSLELIFSGFVLFENHISSSKIMMKPSNLNTLSKKKSKLWCKEVSIAFAFDFMCAFTNVKLWNKSVNQKLKNFIHQVDIFELTQISNTPLLTRHPSEKTG